MPSFKRGDIVRVVAISRGESDRRYDEEHDISIGIVGIIDYVSCTDEFYTVRFSPLEESLLMNGYQLEKVGECDVSETD